VVSPPYLASQHTGDNVVRLSMENWMNKYSNAVHFDSEQEFVDYMFIWLIYASYGVLLSMEELAVAA
jgi:hypothetical protein